MLCSFIIFLYDLVLCNQTLAKLKTMAYIKAVLRALAGEQDIIHTHAPQERFWGQKLFYLAHCGFR